MKKSIFVITTFALMFALVAISCDRSSDRMERAETSVIESERDLRIAVTEVEADAKVYRLEVANDISENEAAIAKIREDIKKEEDLEKREAYEVRIAGLERTNNDLKQEIDNYRVTNRNNWNTFKNNFSSSMDDLGDSLSDFFSRTTASID